MDNKSRVLVFASLAVCLAWLSAPLSAHHGTNQSYDRSAPVTVAPGPALPFILRAKELRVMRAVAFPSRTATESMGQEPGPSVAF